MNPEPLSRGLERLAADAEVRTLNELVAMTEGRGIYLVMILLCLPFVTPVPIPLLSNVVGLALMIVAVRVFLGLPDRLPSFLGSKTWPRERMQKVIRGSLRLLNWMERVVKPRRSEWLGHRWVVRFNAVVLGFMAFFLALPIALIPLSNSFPAYAIILLCASMMERDGALIWFAYLASLATTAYFGFFSGVAFRLIVAYQERVIDFIRNLL